MDPICRYALWGGADARRYPWGGLGTQHVHDAQKSRECCEKKSSQITVVPAEKEGLHMTFRILSNLSTSYLVEVQILWLVRKLSKKNEESHYPPSKRFSKSRPIFLTISRLSIVGATIEFPQVFPKKSSCINSKV